MHGRRSDLEIASLELAKCRSERGRLLEPALFPDDLDEDTVLDAIGTMPHKMHTPAAEAMLDVDTKEVTEIADDPQAFGLSYSWSPRGGHLAYSLGHPNSFRSIFIWSAADGESRQVTEEIFNEFTPSFGPDGDYLYFIADREYHQ